MKLGLGLGWVAMSLAACSSTQAPRAPGAAATVDEPMARIEPAPEVRGLGEARMLMTQPEGTTRPAGEAAATGAGADGSGAGALPPGHPALPAGHPQVGDEPGGMPAGHPAVGDEPGGMPTGHPAVEGMPEGHSATGGMPGGMPAGHPAVGNGMPGGMPAAGRGGMPAGHPDISQMNRNQAPATQAASIGTLEIHVSQGTAGGPAVGADGITLELYHRGQKIDAMDGKLREDGTLIVDGVPVTLGVQPLVKVVHDGVVYSAVGQTMDSTHPNQTMDVTVYQATEQRPDFRLRARHVSMQSTAQGLRVEEMLMVECPGDKAWTGAPAAGGKPVTLELTIPADAFGVELGGGFEESMADVRPGRILSHLPITPGQSTFQASYFVPVTEGKAEVNWGASAPVANMMVFLPADGSTVKLDGLEALGSRQMDGGETRYYKAGPVEAGKVVGMELANVPKVAATVDDGHDHAAEMKPAGSSATAKIIAGVGAAVVLLAGLAFILIKPAGTSAGKAAGKPADKPLGKSAGR